VLFLAAALTVSVAGVCRAGNSGAAGAPAGAEQSEDDETSDAASSDDDAASDAADLGDDDAPSEDDIAGGAAPFKKYTDKTFGLTIEYPDIYENDEGPKSVSGYSVYKESSDDGSYSIEIESGKRPAGVDGNKLLAVATNTKPDKNGKVSGHAPLKGTAKSGADFYTYEYLSGPDQITHYYCVMNKTHVAAYSIAYPSADAEEYKAITARVDKSLKPGGSAAAPAAQAPAKKPAAESTDRDPEWLALSIESWSIEKTGKKYNDPNDGGYYTLRVSLKHTNKSKDRVITGIFDKEGELKLTKAFEYDGEKSIATSVFSIDSPKNTEVNIGPGQSYTLTFATPVNKVSNTLNTGGKWQWKDANKLLGSGGWNLDCGYSCTVKSRAK
jgi:hypothetical protein